MRGDAILERLAEWLSVLRIKATGVVDYLTLTAASYKPISTYMYKVMSTE